MLSDFFLKEESELFIGLLLLVFHKDRRVVNQLFHIILSAVANKTPKQRVKAKLRDDRHPAMRYLLPQIYPRLQIDYAERLAVR